MSMFSIEPEKLHKAMNHDPFLREVCPSKFSNLVTAHRAETTAERLRVVPYLNQARCQIALSMENLQTEVRRAVKARLDQLQQETTS